MRVTHATHEVDSRSLELVNALGDKKALIQADIDSLMAEIQEATKAVDAIREKVKALRPELVPLTEMQAGLVNMGSRDKYFPDLSKNQFIDLVESNINQ